MARPRPITLGLTALLGAILGLAFWLIARPRHPAPPPPAAAEPALEAEPRPHPAPPPPNRAPAPTPPAIRRAPAPPPAPVAAAAARPEASDADTPPARMPSAMRRDVLVRNHNLRLSEADEEIFGTLNLPEATRARIREINDQHRKLTEQGVSSTEPPAPRAGVALTADEARQLALRQLLGGDGAQQFSNQERGAIRKIRGKYRFEWGRQLRE